LQLQGILQVLLPRTALEIQPLLLDLGVQLSPLRLQLHSRLPPLVMQLVPVEPGPEGTRLFLVCADVAGGAAARGS
jgi:hypothetical protein